MAPDTTPISNTDAIFARAYAAAIKSVFLPPGPIGEHDILLTAPVTQRGMAAGQLIYPEMTNYLIYMVGDALQYSDNPVYIGGDSDEKYIDQLQGYLEEAETKGTPDQQQVLVWLLAYREFKSADAQFRRSLSSARADWNAHHDAYPYPTILEWLQAGQYEPYNKAKSRRDEAEIALNKAMEGYYGPDADKIITRRESIQKAQSKVNPQQALNHMGLNMDKGTIYRIIDEANGGTKVDNSKISPFFGLVPLYDISRYTSTVDTWIEKAKSGGKRDQTITIDINKGKTTSWSDYGFKEVTGGGSSGLWPFFWAEVKVNSRWERITLRTEGEEASINLSLAMYGHATLPINAGQWDVPNIRAIYNLRAGAPSLLDPQHAKVSSVLVGYDVEVKLQFSGRMKSEVQDIVSQVKETKGRMSVLGFYVDLSGEAQFSERVHTDFKDVKWDEQSGAMSLTPTKGQVYPTILGVIAQRFERA